MSISKYTVEDFVLDKEFRKWVLSPDVKSTIYWGDHLRDNPAQLENARIARALILNLPTKRYFLKDSESEELWNAIDQKISEEEEDPNEGRVIPLNSQSVLLQKPAPQSGYLGYNQWLKVASILVILFSLTLVYGLVFHKDPTVEILMPKLVYEEYSTSPGVKSTLTLQDGSKVMLNSGSSIRYVKNFEANRRVIYLNGEAYFEVSKDSLRPFTVVSEEVRTTALGTAFNVSSYSGEQVKISLVEGKVSIDVPDPIESSEVLLSQGEELRVDSESGNTVKEQFDSELVLAWTNKKIIFHRMKIKEAVRLLENWYGVEIELLNNPRPDLLVYGVFQDETLENVLEGLSYTVRFDYSIHGEEVKIHFNPAP